MVGNPLGFGVPLDFFAHSIGNVAKVAHGYTRVGIFDRAVEFHSAVDGGDEVGGVSVG